MRWLAAALLALGAALAPRDEELERLVRALDAAREPEWTRALDGLCALGAPAAERVLSDFAARDFAARRARAKLLLQIPAPALCAPVLSLVDDPDPQVRRLLALLLGSPALADEGAAERVAALERMARADPNDYVRVKAREALGECGLAPAVPALDRLLEELPASEAEKAATTLVQLPAARELLIARVAAAFSGERVMRLEDGVLAALLSGYGRALAEVPAGGAALRERLPFLRGRTHPAPPVQAAARLALGQFVARAAELGEGARAEQVLAQLAAEGWPREECLRRRIDLAWTERADPQLALELARALAQAAQTLGPQQAEAWEVHARFLEGAALAALGNGAGADALFAALAERLAAARTRRLDLYPSPRAEQWTEGGGAAHIDALHLEALAHLWRALLALQAGQDGPTLAHLRRTHLCFLESRVTAIRTGATDPSTLDSLFERDLSPYTLVLFNEKLAPGARVAALDLALALGRAWGRVAPLELQGFEGAETEPRELGDVFLDPERLAALRALRAAERRDLARKLRELREEQARDGDPEARLYRERVLTYRQVELDRAESEESEALRGRQPAQLGRAELRTVHAQLLDYLVPSAHARNLAAELLSEGRTAEARALCEAALETLRTAPLGSALWSELSSARFELQRGSSFMDEDRPAEAEQAFLQGERRLASIEQKLDELRAAASEPENARQYETNVRLVREWRGEALLSLAVNANVRMHDPARALEYFERAYALNQNPFMRILRACYRARSGKVEEARTVLKTVVPVPSLYYNVACTHALLGEKELALDFLERDLRENHPSAGSRAQKREWALRDPDLASLRGEPRFERLYRSDD